MTAQAATAEMGKATVAAGVRHPEHGRPRWRPLGAGRRRGAGPGRQGNGTLNSIPQADVQPTEWLTIQGNVVSVADDLVEIKTAAGEVIPFEGRPLSYALEQGFSLKVGTR